MDSSLQVEDFPVDSLIEELNSFVKSCKNEGCRKDSAQVGCNESKACSSYISPNRQDKSKIYSSDKEKNKRKRAIPVKSTNSKYELGMNNERFSFNIDKTGGKSKIGGDQSDAEEDSPLIIDENARKKRRSSMIQTGDIPQDVLNVIVKSGIDDQLEDVAMKEKLTNTIVKNIIKQVVTNKSVLAMIKKDIYGIETNDSDLETYEPKLTRARTKELIEKQIINPEEVNSSGSLFLSISNVESQNSSSVMPETRALVTTEFPEDEDDEEYHPELEEDLAGSDEESLASTLGSPSQSCVKPRFSHSPRETTTPSRNSLNDCSPSSSLLKKNILNQHRKQLAQRSLKFSPDESLICSRTRSKCPLTDIPVEHLEMAFEPPDITPDMYDIEVYDEDWSKFLLDLSKPTDSVKQTEDDERIDPEYNLMADADEKSPSLDELREEFRGDRGVRISRREVHELVTDSLSSLESEDEDQEEEEGDDSKNLSSLPDTELEDSILNSSQFVTPGKTSCLSNSLLQENQQLNEIESSSATFKLAREHLEIIEYQLAQHTQLILQTVLMCCYEEKFNIIEDGCNNMLKEIESLTEKTYDETKVKVCNIYSAQKVIQQYNEKREEFFVYRKDKENRKLKNYGTRFYEKNNVLRFPPMLQNILAESCAFPFLDLLSSRIFIPSTNQTNRKGYFLSEYYLLAMSFQEIVPDIQIFSQESRNKNAKYFDSNLSEICNKVTERTKVITKGSFLSDHFCRLLKQNIYKGLHEDNPLIKYTKTGIVGLPKIDLSQKEVLLKEELRPLKERDLQKFPPHFQKIIKRFCDPCGKLCFSGVLNGRKIIVIEKGK